MIEALGVPQDRLLKPFLQIGAGHAVELMAMWYLPTALFLPSTAM